MATTTLSSHPCLLKPYSIWPQPNWLSVSGERVSGDRPTGQYENGTIGLILDIKNITLQRLINMLDITVLPKSKRMNKGQNWLNFPKI